MSAIPASAAVPLVVGVYFAGTTVERALRYLKALSGIIKRNRVIYQIFSTGTPAEIPHLNPTGLDDVSWQLKRLGFEPLGDFISENRYGTPSDSPFSSGPIASPGVRPGPPEPPKSPVSTHAFMRAFAHPVHGCCAKIICVVVLKPAGRGKVTVKNKVTVAVVSYQGTGVDDWSYTTTRGAASPHGALMRHPRRLSTRIPEASVAQLLEIHLRRREEIAKLAGIVWMRQYSVPDIYEMEKRGIENVRNSFLALSPLKMAQKLFLLKRERSMEWLGELARKV